MTKRARLAAAAARFANELADILELEDEDGARPTPRRRGPAIPRPLGTVTDLDRAAARRIARARGIVTPGGST